MDLVAEVLRDDVARVLAKEKIISTSFDDYYSKAVKVLTRNIEEKRHLSGIQRLLSCTDIKLGLEIILSKLRGHTHSEMLANRKNSVANLKSKYINTTDVVDVNSDPLDLIILEEDEKIQQHNQHREVKRFHDMIEDGEIAAVKSSAGHAQLFFNF